ncbi:hypothetical protein J6590_093115 [Homalodisca vitripennis]|nr:hypothetical protein J6590_093115 [Homalodisca vitripennis]
MKRASSAQRSEVINGERGMSLIYHRKSIGLRTGICGTPAVIGRTEEVGVPTYTEKRRPVRNCGIVRPRNERQLGSDNPSHLDDIVMPPMKAVLITAYLMVEILMEPG